ncbi:MAG: hypothetical protein V4724_20125 [Pseudomonadota bacterium]
MKSVNLPALLLRARLRAERIGPGACAALVLCVLGVAAWGWLLPQRAAQRQELARPLPVQAAPASVVAPPSANQNLAGFYDVLGEQRYAEQQIKLLFGLAAKAGLELNQGEYKFGYDQASRVTTYQVVLPVKGSYRAIWQFVLEALRAIPFAALDEIGFRRDNVTDTQLEARLRLTLYLKGTAMAVQP